MTAVDHQQWPTDGEVDPRDDCAVEGRFEALLRAADQPCDLDRLASLAVAAVGDYGSSGGVVMLVDHLGAVVAAGLAGVSCEIAAALGPLVLGGRVPLLTAMRTGVPVWMPSPATLRVEYPEFADMPSCGKATASLPLRWNGKVIGGLGITFAEPQVFSDTDRALLGAVAAATARGVLAFLAEPARVTAAASLIELLDDAAAEVDGQGRLASANSVAMKMHGFVNAAADAAAHAFLHPPDANGVRQVGVRCLKDGDGRDRFVEFHVGPPDDRAHRVVVGVTVGSKRPAAAPDSSPWVRLTDDEHDRAVQAVFAASMSLAALNRSVPASLRSHVDDLCDRLDRLVAAIDFAR